MFSACLREALSHGPIRRPALTATTTSVPSICCSGCSTLTTTARSWLRSFNVTRQAVRWRVEDSIGPVGEPQPGHVPFTPRAKSTLQRSRYEAEVRGHHRVEPSDILAALMWESESAAAKAVASLGVHPADVRGHVMSDGQSTGE
jgi:ATP-dependent Clp protease ATP-binding subunit ClpA